jgi:hypothetical protein
MLFNLKDDIKETNNLEQQHPEIVKMLKNITLKWRNSLPEYRLND